MPTRAVRSRAVLRKSIMLSDYKLTEYIGEGSYGRVFKGYQKEKPNTLFAIKVIDGLVTPDDLIKQEVKALHKLEHPNIIKILEMIYCQNQVSLVLEHKGFNLFDTHHVYRNNGPRIKKMFAQMVSALQYMHECNYVHRDLSPGNILLSGENLDKVTIIDLGMTTPYFEDGKYVKLTFACGTPGFNAPEMRNAKYFYDGRYLDIWSCGALLHFMVFSLDPFSSDQTYYEKPGNPPEWFTEKKTDYKYFDGIEMAEHLMKKMLQKNPEDRCTWLDVMHHSWIEDYRGFFEKQISLARERELEKKNKEMTVVPCKDGRILTKAEIDDLKARKRRHGGGLPDLRMKMHKILDREGVDHISLKIKIQEDKALHSISDPSETESVISPVEYPMFDNRPFNDDLMEISPALNKKCNGAEFLIQESAVGNMEVYLKKLIEEAENDYKFNHFKPVCALNENNGSANRITHFLDDAAAPYRAQLNNITPFFGPSIKKMPLPVETNPFVKRRPFPQNKSEVPSVIVLPLPDEDEVPPNNGPSTSVQVKLISVDDTPGSAAKKLLSTEEPSNSVEDKASPDHAPSSLERNLPLTDHVTSTQLFLKKLQLNVTKLRPQRGKISPRTITSTPPYEMLQSIKRVLHDMGILNQMSGYLKMKCFRPQYEEASIMTRIQKAVRGLLFGDQAKDIRFTIQLNRLNNVPGYYAVNIKRLQGNKILFKVLRKEILDSLNLYK